MSPRSRIEYARDMAREELLDGDASSYAESVCEDFDGSVRDLVREVVYFSYVQGRIDQIHHSEMDDLDNSDRESVGM